MDKKRLQELAGIESKEIILLNESDDQIHRQIKRLLLLAKNADTMYKKGTLDLPDFVADLIKKLRRIERQIETDNGRFS